MADPTVTPLFNVPINPNLSPADPLSLVPKTVMQPTVTNAVQAAPAPTTAASGLTDEDQAWKARHSGVAGVARSVLGNLGDFLLTHLGMQAQYNPSQKQHRLNYAYDSGIDPNDPNSQLKAIDNVQAIDFAQGAKLRDQFIDNQRLAAQNAATNEARTQRLALAQEAQDRKTSSTAAAYINSLGNLPEAQRAAAYAKILPQVRTLALQNGLKDPNDPTKDGLQLPDTYDPDLLGAFVSGAVPVGTQVKLGQGQQKIENQADQFEAKDATTQRGQDMRKSTAEESITQRASSSAARVAASANRPAKSVQQYTGADGYRHTTMSDGRDIKSPVKVLPHTSAGAANAAQAQALKNKYGLK